MQFITTGNRIMTENFSVGLFYTITFLNGNILACSCNGIGENFVSFLCVEPYMQFILDISTADTIDTIEVYGGGAGTMNYNELENKPSINGEPLVGNLTTTDLHIRAVPTIDTTDNNKVLTASYAGGVTSYSWQTVPSGTTNYNDLTNKPEINGHVLSGNQLPSQLGLATSAQGTLADTAVQPADLASYQPLIDNSHKLSSDLVDDSGHTNKFATQSQLDQITTNQNNIVTLADSGGAKNLFRNIATSGSYRGVDYTVNADGTIATTGTTTQNYFKIVLGNFTFENGVQYVVSGCPTGGSAQGYQITTSGDTYFNDFGNGYTLTGNGNQYEVIIYAPSTDVNMDGLTFKPMICTKAQWDISHKYQPYAMSISDITAWILSQT